jgi:uncharacterized protein YbjT (DUF2867 family)
MTQTPAQNRNETALVLGGTGKTGRRVARALGAHGFAVRTASRTGAPRFDWEDRATWGPVLDGATVAYLAYHPAIGDPGAAATLGDLAALAAGRGVRRIALLSARGEDAALPAERAVRDASADCTVIRASRFCENFTEGVLRDGSPRRRDRLSGRHGPRTLRRGPGHRGRRRGRPHRRGPCGPHVRADRTAPADLRRGRGRDRRGDGPRRPLHGRPAAGVRGAARRGRPAGRGRRLPHPALRGPARRPQRPLTDDVKRVLGREPRDFGDFAREAAAAGEWRE